MDRWRTRADPKRARLAPGGEEDAEGRARALKSISRETAARLDRFVATLRRWQPVVPLVAASTYPVLWTRHVGDSLQLVRLAPAARIWVDFGSGAGFPGLVIACALADVPGACVHLIERHGKKAAFLREAVRVTGAAAVVHQGTVEAVVRGLDARVDVVTARAFARLFILVNLAEPLLKTGAQALFLKGQDVGAELTEVAKYWKIDVNVIPSQSDPRGRIVQIRSAQRRSPPGSPSPSGSPSPQQSGAGHDAKCADAARSCPCQSKGGRRQDHHGDQSGDRPGGHR